MEREPCFPGRFYPRLRDYLSQLSTALDTGSENHTVERAFKGYVIDSVWPTNFGNV